MNDCEIPEEEWGLFEALCARRSKHVLNTGGTRMVYKVKGGVKDCIIILLARRSLN